MNTIISALAARQMFGEMLDRTFYNQEEFIVQRKGKNLAKLVPISAEELPNTKSFAGIWKNSEDIKRLKRSLTILRKRSRA